MVASRGARDWINTMTAAGLSALILILAGQLARGQDSLDYRTFARRADSLWIARDRNGFETLVRGHREHLHRYFVACEIALIRSKPPADRAGRIT